MLSAPVKTSFDSLPENLRDVLLAEMDLETPPESEAAVKAFASTLIQKYFPYLLQTKSPECQNAPLKAFSEEVTYFNARFPEINTQDLLRAFSGESKEDVLATEPTDKVIPMLRGILLANDPEIPVFDSDDHYFHATQRYAALTCAVRQRDLQKVKELAGSSPIPYRGFYITQAMAIDDIDMALYFHGADEPAKQDDYEKMLMTISHYDNDAAFQNAAKCPEISVPFLVKELFGVDVVPRVRIGLLKALDEKYQAENANHRLKTFLGYGDSIWKLKGQCYFNQKSNTVSLLIWSMHQGNDELIGGILKLADKNTSDFSVACNAKVEALNFAVQHGRTGALKTILKDQNVPLSVKDKTYALTLAKDAVSCQMLHDSIRKQAGVSDMPENTSITFAFENEKIRQPAATVATTQNALPRNKHRGF